MGAIIHRGQVLETWIGIALEGCDETRGCCAADIVLREKQGHSAR
jgi:hypothetical protein